jgi:uncharacterized protein (TIGR02453 family)
MNLTEVFSFLNELSNNNNREWFNEQKNRFVAIKNDFEGYIQQLIPKVREIDSTIGYTVAKDCIFRIYRDVRFSPNKDPYKTHLGAYISKDGRKSKLAGYYLHLQPNHSFLAAGLYLPDPIILKEIRYEILDNPDEFNRIISNKQFVNYFSKLNGDSVKTIPKGFPKDFEFIDLIKFKSYEIVHELSDETLLSDNFETHLLNGIEVALPYNQYFNKIIEHTLSES